MMLGIVLTEEIFSFYRGSVTISLLASVLRLVAEWLKDVGASIEREGTAGDRPTLSIAIMLPLSRFDPSVTQPETRANPSSALR
jgi:hypothetical protein